MKQMLEAFVFVRIVTAYPFSNIGTDPGSKIPVQEMDIDDMEIQNNSNFNFILYSLKKFDEQNLVDFFNHGLFTALLGSQISFKQNQNITNVVQ
jgi:hypothetical protein